MTYQIVTRTKPSKKGRSGNSGPDRYMAVLGIPENVTAPYVLNRSVLEKRGIKFFYIGEYYSRHGHIRGMQFECTQKANELITSMQ